jgi:hypothetical protein
VVPLFTKENKLSTRDIHKLQKVSGKEHKHSNETITAGLLTLLFKSLIIWKKKDTSDKIDYW